MEEEVPQKEEAQRGTSNAKIPLIQGCEPEPWLVEDLIPHYRGKTQKFFVLYGNVRDYVLVRTKQKGQKFVQFYDIRSYLTSIFLKDAETIGEKLFSAVIFYSLTRGFYTVGSYGINPEDSYKWFVNKTGTKQITRVKLHREYEPPPFPGLDGQDALQIIGQLLRQQDPVVIVIDHAEALVPPETFARVHAEKFAHLELLRELCFDPAVQASPNLLVLLTENLKHVDDMLFQAGGYKAVRLGVPGPEKRRHFLEYLSGLTGTDLRKLQPVEAQDFLQRGPKARDSQVSGDQAEELAMNHLAVALQGFTLRAIDSLNRQVAVQNRGRHEDDKAKIDRQLLNEARKEAIFRDSCQGLSEIRPRGGFECVGGLDHIVGYFKKVARRILAGNLQTVPKMVLLAGPPGTGKTILAEALASEALIPMFRMGNVMSMWLGESERILEQVLKAILDWEPVLVFVDEADQILGKRVEDLGRGDASRSEARVFGRLLEFMGDEKNRGKVMWVAATNRPDSLDPAMLRRFDRRFPVLLPYEPKERESILEAFVKNGIPSLKYAEDVDLQELAEKMSGFTGSEMEQVVIDAMALDPGSEGEAGEPKMGGREVTVTQDMLRQALKAFVPSRNEEAYRLQTLVSIEICNHTQDLPDSRHLPDDEIRTIVQKLKGEADEQQEGRARLRRCIRDLKLTAGGGRW